MEVSTEGNEGSSSSDCHHSSACCKLVNVPPALMMMCITRELSGNAAQFFWWISSYSLQPNNRFNNTVIATGGKTNLDKCVILLVKYYKLNNYFFIGLIVIGWFESKWTVY